jgi:hypothetical protein
MNSPSPFMNIPVAILIFDNNGLITYRAYSPESYHFNEDGSNPDHRSEQFAQFLARVHNRVAYNPMDAMQNQSNYGQLKEIHTRHVQIPIAQRNNGTCYFSTYIHTQCNYKPIHYNSPVFFDTNLATAYADQQPNLGHRNCPHEIV